MHVNMETNAKETEPEWIATEANTPTIAAWWPDGIAEEDAPTLAEHDRGPGALEAAQRCARLPSGSQAWDASKEGWGPGKTWRKCWVWRPGCPAITLWTFGEERDRFDH